MLGKRGEASDKRGAASDEGSEAHELSPRRDVALASLLITRRLYGGDGVHRTSTRRKQAGRFSDEPRRKPRRPDMHQPLMAGRSPEC